MSELLGENHRVLREIILPRIFAVIHRQDSLPGSIVFSSSTSDELAKQNVPGVFRAASTPSQQYIVVVRSVDHGQFLVGFRFQFFFHGSTLVHEALHFRAGGWSGVRMPRPLPAAGRYFPVRGCLVRRLRPYHLGWCRASTFDW